MEDERFKAEMMRLMGTVINKLDGLDNRLSNVESNVSTLKSDVSELKSVQKEHSQILHRLEAKTDNIAEKVLNHEVRLTKAEQNIEDLRGGVH